MAHAQTAHDAGKYYIPHGSKWPIVGAVSLFVMMLGAAALLNGVNVAPFIFWAGFASVLFMFYGWFGTVIGESQAGMYNAGVDKSFRMGMMWFIFSEVMFFAAFFGALYYARTGFHGLHVTLGAIMLVVIWLRVMKGHFTPKHHFAFEAVAWYWHFVDVVWLGLFIFVYWL